MEHSQTSLHQVPQSSSWKMTQVSDRKLGMSVHFGKPLDSQICKFDCMYCHPACNELCSIKPECHICHYNIDAVDHCNITMKYFIFLRMHEVELVNLEYSYWHLSVDVLQYPSLEDLITGSVKMMAVLWYVWTSWQIVE